MNLNEHPLLNSVVLDVVFQHSMEFRELQACRLVCAAWRDATQEKWNKWRSSTSIRLGPETGPRTGVFKGNEGWPINDFLRRYQDPNDQYKLFGYKKFVLCGIRLETSDCLQVLQDEPRDGQEGNGNSNPGNFWSVIGPLAKAITFDKCIFRGDNPRQFEMILMDKLPNIESLKLIHCTTIPQHPGSVDPRLVNSRSNFENLKRHQHLKIVHIKGIAPICFHWLMLLCSNAPTLKVDDGMQEASQYQFGTFAIHFEGRHNGSLKNMDMMDVPFFEGPTNSTRHWELLNISLESLTALFASYKWESNGYVQEDTRGFNDMWVPTLRHHAGTLKTLKLFRPPFLPVPAETTFQASMNLLDELHLSGNIVRNFNFLRRMRNLQVLHIDFRCFDNVARITKLLSRCPVKQTISKQYKPLGENELDVQTGLYVRMGRLKHFHWNMDLPARSIESVRDYMPNLRILETVLSQGGFKAVCQHLPNLEELVLLFGSQVCDDTLTGIWSEGAERHPNITSFSRLKKFQVKTLCNRGGLGDKSVYQGFLQMTTLESVQIYASSSMTEAAELALRQHVAKVKVILRHTPYAFEQNEECCRLHNFLGLAGLEINYI